MRLRLRVCRDTWGKHPDELEGLPWAPYMLTDMIALAMVESEDLAPDNAPDSGEDDL